MNANQDGSQNGHHLWTLKFSVTLLLSNSMFALLLSLTSSNMGFVLHVCNLLKVGLQNGHYLVVTIAVIKVHYFHFSLLGVMQSPTVLFWKNQQRTKNMKNLPSIERKTEAASGFTFPVV